MVMDPILIRAISGKEGTGAHLVLYSDIFLRQGTMSVSAMTMREQALATLQQVQ